MNNDSTNTIAASLDSIALALSNLGNGNAATSMGAIEAASIELSTATETLARTHADGMEGVRQAIREHMAHANYETASEINNLAESLDNLSTTVQNISDKWHASVFPK